MSHHSTGYFYCQFTYNAPFILHADPHKTQHVDHAAAYLSAFWTPARQDHKAQSQWYTNNFLPAAHQDVLKNYYGDANRNKLGRSYHPYDAKYIHPVKFHWCEKLPVHTDGPLKGHPYGKEIKIG